MFERVKIGQEEKANIFILYNNFMLELYFSVQVPSLPEQTVSIVGSSKQLGAWNPKAAVNLAYTGQVWEGRVTNVRHGVKLEFKIVKVKQNEVVQWQSLPENSNRKYRPKTSVQLHLTWGEAAGTISSISRNTFKLKGLPAVMIKGQPSKKSIGSEEFDPYMKAHYDESDEDNEEEFRLIKKKMSDIISLNCQDLEEIYCKNSSVEILTSLQKKEKIYVISNCLEEPSELQVDLQEELNQLSGTYMTRWINAECVKPQHSNKKSRNLKRAGSLFEISPQQLHFHSLNSKTSYFILTDLSVVNMVEQQISGQISACLYLPANKYDAVIEILDQLKNIDIICFDSPSANKAFYEYLISRSENLGPNELDLDFLSLQTPSVQSIVLELKKLKERRSDTESSSQCIRESQILKTVKRPNSITILDEELVEDLMDELVDQQGAISEGHSMLIIICEGQIPTFLLNKPKNWVLIYDNFEKIKIKGKEYFPIRSFRQIIEQIRLKSLIYKESHGGEVVQKENALIYTLPPEKVDMAIKIQSECQKILKKIPFARISRKQARVKISWNLSKEARMIRSICELKYISHGSLGQFNLISQKMNFKELKEDIKYLIECQSKIFAKGPDTEVAEYEFGSQISANQGYKMMNEEMGSIDF